MRTVLIATPLPGLNLGGEGGSGGDPPLPVDSRAAGWTEACCQRLALGHKSPGDRQVRRSPAPHAYPHATAATQQGAGRRATLHDLLTPHAVLSYAEAHRLMFGKLDNRNGSVTCVYTGRMIRAGDSIPDSTVERRWRATAT